jgi:hypothetical protein
VNQSGTFGADSILDIFVMELVMPLHQSFWKNNRKSKGKILHYPEGLLKMEY